MLMAMTNGRLLFQMGWWDGKIQSLIRRYGFRHWTYNRLCFYAFHVYLLSVVYLSVSPHVHRHTRVLSNQPIRHVVYLTYILPLFALLNVLMLELAAWRSPGFASGLPDLRKGGHCDACQRPRPARAMHCSRCGGCILRKDFHSPWVNNCIGAHNQLFYVLHLAFTVAEMTMVLDLLHHSLELAKYQGALDLQWIIAGVVALMFGVVSFLLFGFQLPRCIWNVTLSELLHYDRIPYLVLAPELKCEFDRGVARNLWQLFTQYEDEATRSW
mmetsp:Transcript_17087/g.48103  ORF Transcript_17087/g.48103 Transcript_17087/m.48103 type:complete len:270 (+) Transcript_17087:303-1112(+)